MRLHGNIPESRCAPERHVPNGGGRIDTRVGVVKKAPTHLPERAVRMRETVPSIPSR
jgi:hypothetical protein